jgi:galactokinase
MRSQHLAERLLGNQVPQTIHLAASAYPLGAVAASAFGAGFGGAVWAMVPREAAAEFATRWRQDYLERFPECADRAVFFATEPGPGAS